MDVAEPRKPAAVWRDCGPAFALVLLVSLVYFPAIRCGFIWDDDDYVTSNPTLRNAEGLRRIWTEPRSTPQYYPLVYSTFWIEYHLWGVSPAGYHLVNVLLHAGNAVLVWLILRKLGVPGAWFAAAIFGLHPVHVESVAWVAERKNVLSGLFYLTALWVYLDVARLGVAEAGTARHRGAKYAAATLLFMAALLSKSVTCSLPAVIVLLILWKRQRLTREDIGPLVPWFLFGLATALGTVLLERVHVGAAGAPFAWSFVERCLIAARALCFYAGKVVWPRPLSFMYARWSVSASDPRQWLYVVLVLAALATLVAARRRGGTGLLTAALYFAGTLLPALGFFNVYPMRYSFVADHFQYLASLGPITLFAAAAVWFFRGPAARMGASTSVGAGLAFCLLGVLALTTWNRERVFRSSEAVWSDVLSKNRQSGIAHFYLGKIRTAQGRFDLATEHLRAAARLQNDETELHIVHTLLANSLVRQGELDKAQTEFEEALRYDPTFWEALNGLGNLLARRGEVDGAIDLYRRGLTAAPAQATLHQNLANALAVKGELDDAEVHYRESIRLDPTSATAHLNLGNLLARQKRFAEAAQEFSAALRLDPDLEPARRNLARVRGAAE